MAATTKFINRHGASPGTLQDPATSAYLMAADLASTTGNRDANPVVVVAATTVRSYERWTRLEITGGTFTQLTTFRQYISGFSPPTGVSLFTSAQATPQDPTYATPVNTDSTFATTTMPTSDPGAARIFGTLTASGQQTGYVVMQVDVVDTATAGFDATITWAWAETA